MTRSSLALFALALFTLPVHAALSVSLTTSLPSPQPLGTPVTLHATVSGGSSSDAYDYRFVVDLGSAHQNYRDFNLADTFTWVPAQVEGSYVLAVTVRDRTTKAFTYTTIPFQVTSRLNKGLAAVTPTANSLVALFSAPPCSSPNSMRIRFQKLNATASQTTNLKPCNGTTSMNWYIAGMYNTSTYQMHYEVLAPNGSLLRSGSTLDFTTGALPSNISFPATQVVTPAPAPNNTLYPILLHGYLPLHANGFVTPAATDLSGNAVWYLPYAVSLLTRTETGGNLLIIFAGSSDPHGDIVREVDLAGNIIKETNASRISEQLGAFGVTHPTNSFHHEARLLPNGNYAVLGSDEMLSTTAQGGTQQNPVDILGAQVLVLNSDFQLAWVWDAFDHLDINRPAVLGEICTVGKVGCPEFHLATQANDWLHANSVQEAADNSIVVSLRHQDWVIKINYANGTGDGALVWTMGLDGNFAINSTDPYPWFSHQHDANFQDANLSVLSCYDNGNTRKVKFDSSAHSRGYVLSVDETNMQVTTTILSDLGGFSTGLGSAQLFPNGNYHFESGYLVPSNTSESVEVDPAGAIVYGITEQDTTYRSFRMQDLYTPVPN